MIPAVEPGWKLDLRPAEISPAKPLFFSAHTGISDGFGFRTNVLACEGVY
jgi:hypothetical protein